MIPSVAFDNDILIKCACYDLLNDLRTCASDKAVVLGLARYVVTDQLSRRGEIRNREVALARFDGFLSAAIELEPTPEETALATTLEETATSRQLALDTGESLLCAIVILRSIPLLITGDKRAIEALELLLPVMTQLVGLIERVACLEQYVLGVVRRTDEDATRVQVCAEPDVDKVMAICFECSNRHGRASSIQDCLTSYIYDLRGRARRLLPPADALFAA